MLLKVRVKGILEALIENTKVGNFPTALLEFLRNLLKDGGFAPNNFLTPWEMNRVDVDNYGAFINLDEKQRQMISGFYVFAKLFVVRVLLKSTE